MGEHPITTVSCYVVVPSDKVTARMVNKSLSHRLSDIPVVDNKAIIEVPMPVDDVFLDFPLLTASEIVAWQNEIVAGIEGSVWAKIKRLLGLVPII